MKHEVNPALEAALLELGRATTPDELRRRGVRRVVSIGKADVSRLIEITVNRTLLVRTIGGLSEEERRFVIDAAEEAFSGDVRTMSDLASSREALRGEREGIQDELAELKRQLAFGDGTGIEEVDAKARAARLKPLRLRVQARLLPLFDALPTGEAHRLPTLRATVLELMAVFAQEYEAGLERERLSMTGKVENLERRIHKLMKTLEETEDVLARVAQMKNLEVGIESIYRTVQGLNPAEADRELKLALMKTIFEANLEMRGSMAV